MTVERLKAMALWMVFVVALSIVGVAHACFNVTPLRMAEQGFCSAHYGDGSYEPCSKK